MAQYTVTAAPVSSPEEPAPVRRASKVSPRKSKKSAAKEE